MRIIYGIYNNEQLLYIGSTKNFIDRKRVHLANINYNNTNSSIPLYQYIKQNNLIIDIREISTHDLSKDETANIENQLINQLNPLMNKRIAYKDTRESTKIYQKNYYENKKYINNEINQLLNIVY